MKFEASLRPARLKQRYKRFLADAILADGSEVTVHCPNPGAMLGLAAPGSQIGLLPARNPKAKLAWSWELSHADGDWVGINTGRPNRLAEEAIRAGLIEPLQGYDTTRREVRYARNSRIDLLLSRCDDAPDCYVEVKNVHLMRTPGLAEFPDSVTARGAKHLGALAAMVESGRRAVMLFIVQRNDCATMALADDIDPNYAGAMAAARRVGVEVTCYGCRVTAYGIAVDRPLAWVELHGSGIR